MRREAREANGGAAEQAKESLVILLTRLVN